MKRYVFPDPLDATCKLQPDSMSSSILGVADTHPDNGAPCQSFDVPATVPNRHGASLTIERAGFAPIVLHGILDTMTAGGGGFECDVFRMQRCCAYQVVTQQPIIFDSNGGSGSFEIKAAAGCMWDADEDHNAEDWVKVASGVIDGSGTKTFNVLSKAQQPNVPLPRTGFIDIFDQPGGKVVAKVQIQQK